MIAALALATPGQIARGGDLSDWYKSLRRQSPTSGVMVSCCAEHDAVYADTWSVDQHGRLVAIVTGSGPRSHSWAPIGRKYLIPDYMIIWNGRNPTGHALMFLKPTTLEPICFVFSDGV